MASGGLPHQPLPAAFLAHFGKDSLGHSNAGLLDSRGPAATALPPPEIHPRHIVPDERDAFISWLRGEFAAANAIIDAMCHHLRMIGEPSEYDFLFTCIQQRRYNWTLVLHMQQFFSVAEVIYALQQATWRKQQVRNTNQPLMQHRSMEDFKDPRTLSILRGLKGEVPSIIPQSEVSVSDMSAVISRDLSLTDLSISQEIYNGKRMQSPGPRINDLEASQSLSKSGLDSLEQSPSQVSPDLANRAMSKSPEGQETHTDAENKSSTASSKSPVVLLGALAVSTCGAAAKKKRLQGSSSVCESIECPSYEVVYEADDFSVRLYNGTVWMATSAIQDISFYSATQTGFLRLFAYIQGANEEGVSVDMTAPVLTGVIPSDGPFCETSFIVRFYVPTANQESPPTPISSLDLQVESWDAKYFAVRQFGGFATDTNVVEEGATLSESVYEAGFTVASTSSDEESYFVAQYNSPFQISGRVNEVLLPLSYSSLLMRKSP